MNMTLETARATVQEVVKRANAREIMRRDNPHGPICQQGPPCFMPRCPQCPKKKLLEAGIKTGRAT